MSLAVWVYIGCMAKRGEKRPWRARFQWDNGVKGAKTFSTVSELRSFVEQIRETAELRDMGLSLKVEKDGQSQEIAGRPSAVHG